VPSLIALPEPGLDSSSRPTPTVLWLHGRTVSKELDPGRYLRWIRSGIAACAIDLPGHGERFDERLQTPEATLEVVELAAAEIDAVVEALRNEAVALGLARSSSDAAALPLAIGGMSLGGMVSMVRLCRDHSFRAASVEATTGSWSWQMHRAMWDAPRAEAMNPITHLDGWREIPFQALHARHDEWVAVDGQREFIEALRRRALRPEQITMEIFEERTGAPNEHAGFGRYGAEAKERQLAFWRKHLEEPQTPA
jgi:alpha-beta hydrolase superfamily lysophospholipase